MRTLIVEDDFVSRNLLNRMLEPFGECDIAVNGKEAVKAFHRALDDENPYDLVCLDIMMPEMDGKEVLETIRDYEIEKEIVGSDNTKIIMTTALDDPKTIMSSFRNQCDAYIVKPIDMKQIIKYLISLKLVTKDTIYQKLRI
ncbi:MAG: response regulator [Candidatus Zixiibacteriota bacterium]